MRVFPQKTNSLRRLRSGAITDPIGLGVDAAVVGTPDTGYDQANTIVLIAAVVVGVTLLVVQRKRKILG